MLSCELTPATSKSIDVKRKLGVVAPTTPTNPTRKICRDTLINRLNYLNFQGHQLTALFVHQRHGRTLRLKAHPEPCNNASFTCRWLSPPPPAVMRGEYALQHLEVPQDRHIYKVVINEAYLSETLLSGQLPEDCQQLIARQVKRYPCRQLEVKVIQNGAIFSGILDDFSSSALCMNLLTSPPQNFFWLDPQAPVTLIVGSDNGTVLTTIGDILRLSGERLRQTVVIAPRRDDQRRFPAKKFRGRRATFCPTPQVVFTHPIIGKQFARDVINVSGTGFAVCESASDAVLLPGLTLDNLELRLTDTFALRCKAQVVYCRQLMEQGNDELRHCGLAILDMDIPDHTRLMALLHRAENRRRGVSPPLDLDQLWEFFFSSGFIYPEKYQSLHENRHQFLQTYERLYNSAPNLARHFVFQDNCTILAHMAMLRTCSNSWLIHHHAADHTHSNHAGLDVLQLAGEAINESQGLYSAHMGYVMCYYRPENRFPQRIFGGVANHYQNRALCSVDTFAYFHYHKELDLLWKDGGPWALTPAHEEDLLDVEAYYEQRGGGVMLKALDITPQHPDQRELITSYQQSGFQHQQNLFALRRDGALVALFSTLRTALGLNLSNLTNAITVLVVNPDALPREVYFTAISMLAAMYPTNDVPILTYPESYPEMLQIEVEKHYNLWAIDCRHLDPYFEFCETYFRRLRSGKNA
jgi:hypothetical protein